MPPLANGFTVIPHPWRLVCSAISRKTCLQIMNGILCTAGEKSSLHCPSVSFVSLLVNSIVRYLEPNDDVVTDEYVHWH